MKDAGFSQLAIELLPHFPTLSLAGEYVLERRCDSIIQSITFSLLRTGDYRPACHIVVIPVPQVSWVVDTQLLPIAFRTISEHLHISRRSDIVDCMRRSFKPCLDEPLSTKIALASCLENLAASGAFSGPIAAGVGYMHKSLGDRKSAVAWFARAHAWYVSLDYELADWQKRDLTLIERISETLRD